MKKKFKLSIFSAVALLVVIALVLYFFLYMAPAKQDMALIQAETRLFQTQAQIIEPYLEDHSPLEQDIQDTLNTIDQLHADAYTNERNVNQAIAQAVQRFQVELTSLTLAEHTLYDDTHYALPINLQVKGTRQNLLGFVEYFESDMYGSFAVHSVNLQISGEENCTMAIVMYLCTPSI